MWFPPGRPYGRERTRNPTTTKDPKDPLPPLGGLPRGERISFTAGAQVRPTTPTASNRTTPTHRAQGLSPQPEPETKIAANVIAPTAAPSNTPTPPTHRARSLSAPPPQRQTQ